MSNLLPHTHTHLAASLSPGVRTHVHRGGQGRAQKSHHFPRHLGSQMYHCQGGWERNKNMLHAERIPGRNHVFRVLYFFRCNVFHDYCIIVWFQLFFLTFWDNYIMNNTITRFPTQRMLWTRSVVLSMSILRVMQPVVTGILSFTITYVPAGRRSSRQWIVILMQQLHLFFFQKTFWCCHQVSWSCPVVDLSFIQSFVVLIFQVVIWNMPPSQHFGRPTVPGCFLNF